MFDISQELKQTHPSPLLSGRLGGVLKKMKHEGLIYNKTRGKIPKEFIENVILGTLNFLKLKQPLEMAVLIVSPEEIKKLNKIWRGKNESADELSFGLNSRLPADGGKLAKRQNKMLELGEIVVNANKIFEKNNLAKILIHGLLHLLGYNHEKSDSEAEKMEQLEAKIFKHLNI